MAPLNVNNGQFQSQYFVQIYGVLYLFVGVLVFNLFLGEWCTYLIS